MIMVMTMMMLFKVPLATRCTSASSSLIALWGGSKILCPAINHAYSVHCVYHPKEVKITRKIAQNDVR